MALSWPLVPVVGTVGDWNPGQSPARGRWYRCGCWLWRGRFGMLAGARGCWLWRGRWYRCGVGSGVAVGTGGGCWLRGRRGTVGLALPCTACGCALGGLTTACPGVGTCRCDVLALAPPSTHHWRWSGVVVSVRTPHVRQGNKKSRAIGRPGAAYLAGLQSNRD